MPIKKEKLDALQLRMDKLKISDKDLVEKFILGSGKGGQKVNKTNSCVYLKHIPSGIEIKCSKNRSREMNRYFARKDLCERLEEIIFNTKSAKKKLQEKIRRQKKRSTRKQKEKMLEEKKRHSKIKELRKPPKD